MVVFTCNICGDSVKKPAVAKHYNTKCRGAPKSVSCMDCQKDFKGEDYVEHTSCITEAEKYSGKDYVPKPSQNAGLKKQQCWLEIVRSILSATDIQMSGDVRRTLQRLQSYDNVPRKQHKFINFVVNSLRIRPQQAEPVWKVVEVALEKYKEVRFGPKKTDESKNVNENMKSDEIHDDSVEASNGNVENKQDKKRKKKENQDIANHEGIKDPVVEESTNEVPKKKKKKSKDKENGHDESIVENGTQCVEENTESSKKKKKRASGTENEVPNGVESIQNDDDPPKKTSKSKEPPIETIEVDSDTTTQPPSSFDWTDQIHSIVEKKNQIEVEKLKSKVLKKYKKIYQIDEIPWKVEKTFNKKLRKSGLLIVDNIVKTSVVK